jgi:phospholipid N-methyltransferase
MSNHVSLFFREYLRNFHDTGAIAPSSRWLAKALARYVVDRSMADRPRNILEVGPGTGAVTQYLVRKLAPNDSLTLVELNDRFVEHLRGRLASEAAFSAVSSRVQVLHQRVEEAPSETRYDVIISGLPLNNFAVKDVEQILETFARLLAPGGTLSFFQYIAVRPARALVSGRQERERLQGIGRVLGDLLGKYQIRCEWIWPNVPPAWVHHVRLQNERATEPVVAAADRPSYNR